MILRHAITTGVHPTEAELRLGMPLLRGFAEPSDRFSVILRHAFADGVHHPKVLLRLGVTRFGAGADVYEGGK